MMNDLLILNLINNIKTFILFRFYFLKINNLYFNHFKICFNKSIKNKVKK